MGPRFEDQWRARFEEFAELRDDEAGIAGWTTTGLDARVRRFLGLWKLVGPGQLWLDAGCGAGTYTRILLRHGQRVFAVDYSSPTLRKASGRGLEGAALAVADVRLLPFAQDQFDGALCFGVTQALADSEAGLRELARVVKPGGQLWIDALNGWCLVHIAGALRRGLRGRPRHLRYESPRRIKRLLRAYGFADIQLHWMPIVPGRSQALQRLVESHIVNWLFRWLPPLGILSSHGFIVHAIRPLQAASTVPLDARASSSNG